MKVEHWDGDHLCGDTGFKNQDYTPEEVLANYTGENGYATVMWGAYNYHINNVQYFDSNDTSLGIIVHLE